MNHSHMNRNIGLGASSSPGASPKPGFPGMKAVILAAGFGTRFDPSGRRNKLLHALPDGRPIIRATCENAFAVVSDVIVVCHAFRSEMEAALSGLALMTVYCEDAPQGMGASIRCGLGAPEGLITPHCVLGIRVWPAAAAQVFPPFIANTMCAKRSGQGFLTEMRIFA